LLVECRAIYASHPSLHYHLQFGNHSKPFSRDQTDENQKVQGLDCMVGGQELQISVSDEFPWYGQQNAEGCYQATKGHPATIFLSANKYL
jgi:hypothetical protein